MKYINIQKMIDMQKLHRMLAQPRCEVPLLVTMTENSTCCEYCQRDLREVESLRQERRQVISLPEKRRLVTEHQTESKCCPRCSTVTVAPFPQDVKAPIQYGADVGAVAVYLCCQQLHPLGRTAEILADLLDCPMSPASVQTMILGRSVG